MKKNLLFVMNNLHCGGAEKALISLLETLDYSTYNVDLFLFKHEGLFFDKIPKQVHLLEEPQGYEYFDGRFKSSMLRSIRRGRVDIAISRLCTSYIWKSETNRARCEQRMWKHISRAIKPLPKRYDAAIGFLEKTPIYFCIDKVNADKKIGFIHIDYNKLGMDPSLDKAYFDKLDHLVTVSEECAEVLKLNFPEFQHKVEVMYNIVSPRLIHLLSEERLEFKPSGLKLLSVGRLHPQKGFDLAIEACKDLIDRGYDVTWHIIGEGESRGELEQAIKQHNLQPHFKLLGLKDNPYPYMKEADLYVQPSRFEGKSIAIDEAKILNKPIIVTDFSTAKDQITDRQTGLIVKMNPAAISEGIRELIDNDLLRWDLEFNLSQEQLGTENEINKFYRFVI